MPWKNKTLGPGFEWEILGFFEKVSAQGPNTVSRKKAIFTDLEAEVILDIAIENEKKKTNALQMKNMGQWLSRCDFQHFNAIFATGEMTANLNLYIYTSQTRIWLVCITDIAIM